VLYAFNAAPGHRHAGILKEPPGCSALLIASRSTCPVVPSKGSSGPSVSRCVVRAFGIDYGIKTARSTSASVRGAGELTTRSRLLTFVTELIVAITVADPLNVAALNTMFSAPPSELGN